MSNTSDPKLTENFCDKVELGANFEELHILLSSKDLEIRTKAPKAHKEISNQLSDPSSIDGVLVTSRHLVYPNMVPACEIYFSSPYLGGTNKIIYKQFITKTPTDA